MVKNNAVALLNHIDRQVAALVADNIGAELPEENLEVKSDKKSPALSMANTISKTDTKCVAIILNGVAEDEKLTEWVKALVRYNLNYSIVAKKLSVINTGLKVTDTFNTADSSLFDGALLISNEPKLETPVLEFIETTYKHFKPLAVAISDQKALKGSRVKLDTTGVYDLKQADILQFVEGIKKGRFWNRQL
jgi:catalase